jgi:Zn-dependent protease with chaperone function
MADNLNDIFNPFCNAAETELNSSTSRALINWVEEETIRLGMTQKPAIIHLAHDLPIAYGGTMYSGETIKPVVIITEGALKKVFNAPNLNLHVPDELKALIGHEMSHIADGVQYLQMKRLPVFALPLLSLGAYEIYKTAKHRHADDPSHNMHEHLNNVTAEAKQASPDKERFEILGKNGLDLTHRVAVVGAGLIAGGMLASHMSIRSEFRADRMGAIAAKNPEAIVNMLTKLRKEITGFTGPQVKEWQETMSRRNFMENIAQIYDMAKTVLREMTYDAHPTEAARIKEIRRFGKESGLFTQGTCIS